MKSTILTFEPSPHVAKAMDFVAFRYSNFGYKDYLHFVEASAEFIVKLCVFAKQIPPSLAHFFQRTLYSKRNILLNLIGFFSFHSKT